MSKPSAAPPGELVDIGGGELIHMQRWGKDNPGPVVILDVSAAMPLSEWDWVGPGLADRGFNVVAYDRPGMGWSQGPWAPRDAQHAAEALAKALAVAYIQPPYIVVGHSYGGFSAREFAGTHRDDMAALVLLDTTHPDGGGELSFATTFRTRAWWGHGGLFRLEAPVNWFWELPMEDQAAANAVSLWTSHLDTSAEELEAWNTSAAQLRALGDLGDLPLLVVSSADSPAHLEQQRDIARLSTAGQVVQLNVSHMGMLTSHDQALLTMDAMEKFLATL